MADSMTLIESKLIASDVTSVDFTSLPTTYSHLRLYGSKVTTSNYGIYMRFNDQNSNGNYNVNYMYAQLSGSLTASQSGNTTALYIGDTFGGQNGAPLDVLIPYYRSYYWKPILFRSAEEDSWYGGGGYWSNTGSVTKISLESAGTNGIKTGSLFALYGIE